MPVSRPRATTVLALLLATTACTAAPQAAGPAAPQAPGRPPAASRQAQNLRLPLDAYALTDADAHTLDDAEDILVRRCMSAKGFSWKTLPRIGAQDIEPLNRRRYGAIEMAIARHYGYHPPPDLPAIARRDRAWDERDRLPAAVQRAAYGPTGQGGCLKTAQRQLGGGSPPPDFHAFNQLTGTALNASQRDPTVRRAMRKWSACMAKAGFRYSDAFAAAGSRRWEKTKHPTRTELATAESDVACKGRANLVRVWAAAEVRIQQSLIRENAGRLHRAKARTERWLAAARRALTSTDDHRSRERPVRESQA